MTGYTTPVAQAIAERFAKPADSTDRIAAARRLIERAAPGHARADVIESCYKDAKSPEEVQALLHLAHEIVDAEVPGEVPERTDVRPYGGFEAVSPGARGARRVQESDEDDEGNTE